jgi:CheY-like chemotaxis protein
VLGHKPDVFITDIEMPELIGLDVAGETQTLADRNSRYCSDYVRTRRAICDAHMRPGLWQPRLAWSRIL